MPRPDAHDSDAPIPEAERQRIDRWLWCARFFKTRSLAARMVADGQVRVNQVRVSKASHALKLGDVLTFPQGNAIRVVAVRGFGARRGPPAEARTLYDPIEPETPESRPASES